MAANNFAFHRSYRDAFEMLDAEQTQQLLKAMMGYAFDECDTEFDDPLLKMAWVTIKPNVEASAANSRNGSKGANKGARKAPKKGAGKAPSEGGLETNGTERSGVEKNFLSSGKKESSSTAPDGAAVAEATPPSLPEGWERVPVSCGFHRSLQNIRSPEGVTYCPKCNAEELESLGVIA